MSEIKALEWQDAKDKGYAQANCVLGQYQVSWLGEFECWQCCRPHKDGNSWADNFSRHPSKDEAKAAAQSDYEARIRSALVERKAEPLEYVEKVSTEAAMSQWERSLKRPDLCEKDRVRGAIEAYKRQAFAFAISPTPPAAPVRAFDQIVAARKAHVDAVAAYNARLELVRAERERGNWHIKMDREYDVMSEAQSAFIRTVQELADAALSASPSPVDSRDGLIERLVTPHSYAQEYEFRGDGGDYVPTDAERTMIEDAICGYLGELAEAHLALAAKEQQP